MITKFDFLAFFYRRFAKQIKITLVLFFLPPKLFLENVYF